MPGGGYVLRAPQLLPIRRRRAERDAHRLNTVEAVATWLCRNLTVTPLIPLHKGSRALHVSTCLAHNLRFFVEL